MRAVYVAGVVIAAASLSGCDIGDFQSIPDNQFSMQRDLNLSLIHISEPTRPY